MVVRIYYDGIQEGLWFQKMHPALAGTRLDPFPRNPPPLVARALSYDKPDIILTDDDENPILILEQTTEVPSGHNVGQRFARLAGAAKMRVPSVYFGPFKAYKHGGKTAGPRYMNLRLFYAIEKMALIEDTACTIINWPVDAACEILQTPAKDAHVREYMQLFFEHYDRHGMAGIVGYIKGSQYEVERKRERDHFAATQVRRPKRYDGPPPSVIIAPAARIATLRRADTSALRHPETIFYRIGMRYIRSDPYAGMALLYSYLYADGLPPVTRNVVLHFPKITITMWRALATGRMRKDERLFKMVADGILFKDGYLPKAQL